MRYLCGACTNMLPSTSIQLQKTFNILSYSKQHVFDWLCKEKKQEQDRFLFFMYIYTSPQNNKPHMDYPWLSDIGSPKEASGAMTVRSFASATPSFRPCRSSYSGSQRCLILTKCGAKSSKCVMVYDGL